MEPERMLLERHGIFYVDLLGQSSDSTNHEVSTKIHQYLGLPKPQSQTGKAPIPVPDYIDQMREALLDFRRIMPRSALEFFHANERPNIPQDVFYKDADHPQSTAYDRELFQERMQAIVREARGIARKASKYRQDGASEHEWRRLVEDGVFRRCAEKETLPFSTLERDELFDDYESIRQANWDNFTAQRVGTGGQCLPIPSADLTLGFSTGRSGRITYGFERMPIIHNFSYANLQLLKQRGLRNSPVTPRDQKTHTSPFSSRLLDTGGMCLPFATVHHGPNIRTLKEHSATFQAANAVSRVLTMAENVYRFASMQELSCHIPATIAITCCGPTIRIWTAYSLPNRTGPPAHIMTCIKQINIASTWAVLEMHCVIRNIMRWATRVHRYNISSQLDHWRAQQFPAHSTEEQTPVSPVGPLPSTSVKNHNRVNSLRDIELMAMVRKLEQEKADLEKANTELQERNAELTSFLKQATGQIHGALYEERRADSAMGDGDDHSPSRPSAGTPSDRVRLPM